MSPQYRAILFCDICASTDLYQNLGDREAHAKITAVLKSMREHVSQAGGSVLRTVGDSVLAEFVACEQALAACHAMHLQNQASNLQIRAGFHWGEVIHDSGDVYGDAVNLAARVCDFAKPGETIVTSEVEALLPEALQKRLTLLDVASFKGFSKSTPVFRVQHASDSTEQTSVNRYERLASDIRRSQACQLLLRSGTQTKKLIEHDDQVLIGRAAESDLIVSNKMVSKLHARVECRRGRFVFIDQSTNGSFIAKHDEPYVFVHRDSITLDSRGQISLGIPPFEHSDSCPDSASTDHLIYFALSAASK